ncbi:uncharacterized protein EV154DRAFT_189507 [Mucor mucedo]|uniref:uncharacterized protein n=1 Tax=Mucor mucedo TaxID=29922 RepID=UPI00221E8A83|nr:uncharacterized protein EV154DRAFT_189507 [Mucor mucedo]KAI7892512.1 hypothetical protein EV154DRAFT_189507 [Mucor mucedo]
MILRGFYVGECNKSLTTKNWNVVIMILIFCNIEFIPTCSRYAFFFCFVFLAHYTWLIKHGFQTHLLELGSFFSDLSLIICFFLLIMHLFCVTPFFR